MPVYHPRVTLGGRCRFTASLRVRHPSLDPRLIAAALSLQPEQSRKVGERRRTPKGRLLPGHEKESSCNFRVVDRATTAEEFVSTVDRFIDGLSPAGQFLRSIRAGGGRSDLFVGWFFGVFSALPLDHHWLGKLGDLTIDLDLDLYGGGEQND